MSTTTPLVRFEHVVKRYPGGTTAVAGLDLDVPEGRITVLVGPSGCGKSTSLRMVNRMVVPDAGRVLLAGADVAHVPEARLRRSIGYVIQHGGLFPHRTVLDNVTTVPRLLGRRRREARLDALRLLELVGLDPQVAGRFPAQLSGGQQQRVGVARALAADPPVLLMDEPFSAVDPVVRAQLQRELLRLQRDLGTTVLFVTHDVDEAVLLGDQVVVMREGGVPAQVGTPLHLLRSPADDVVAGFMGRDRGYRALGFVPTDAVPVHPAPTVVLAEGDVPPADGTAWRLAVTAEGRPWAWLPPHGTPADAPGAPAPGTATAPHGTGGALACTPLVGVDDPARVWLDAALGSPCGRAVVVDPRGALRGTVTADDVLAHVRRTTGTAGPTGTGPTGTGTTDAETATTGTADATARPSPAAGTAGPRARRAASGGAG